MKKELSDAEVCIMKELWLQPGATAKDIAFILYQKYDWAPGTSYTLLNRCEKKGTVCRYQRGHWHPAVEKAVLQEQRLRQLARLLFDGSLEQLIDFARTLDPDAPAEDAAPQAPDAE